MSAQPKKQITLFYDVLSPYTWIAFEALCRYRSKWNVDLTLRPFLLGGVMAATGNRPPGMLPAKALYMPKELAILAQYFQIPLHPPANPSERMFEQGSLSAQRLLTVVKQKHPEQLEELSRQLWMRLWSRDQDICSPESLTEACLASGISQETATQLLSEIKDLAIKEKLKATTNEAVELGAFGSPFMVTEIDGKKDVFFGCMTLEILAHTIGEKWEGPLTSLKANY